MNRQIVMATILAIGPTACVDNPPVEISADEPYYNCRVQPIFDKGCSMLACHGDARRPLHTFSRNRLRLEGTNVQRNLLLTQEELASNFDNALSFVTSDPDESFLLLKPLEEDAGGYFHRGAEIFGGPDVFESAEDPEYLVIRQWIAGETESEDCVYPGREP